jgi:hypothetical protein
VPVSKRRGELRHTGDGELFADFDIRQTWLTGIPAESHAGVSQTRRVPKADAAGLSNEKIAENLRTRLASSEAM